MTINKKFVHSWLMQINNLTEKGSKEIIENKKLEKSFASFAVKNKIN